MAWSLAPYIHVILADVVSITLYINKPLVRLTTVHYQSAVSMISFAQVLTAQWSDTIPKWDVQFQVGITSPDILFQQNPAVERRTKHIDIRHHYIREQYEEKVVEPFHVAGEENPADLFTKSLPVVKVERFRSKIGLS